MIIAVNEAGFVFKFRHPHLQKLARDLRLEHRNYYLGSN